MRTFFILLVDLTRSFSDVSHDNSMRRALRVIRRIFHLVCKFFNKQDRERRHEVAKWSHFIDNYWIASQNRRIKSFAKAELIFLRMGWFTGKDWLNLFFIVNWWIIHEINLCGCNILKFFYGIWTIKKSTGFYMWLLHRINTFCFQFSEIITFFFVYMHDIAIYSCDRPRIPLFVVAIVQGWYHETVSRLHI